MSVDGFARRFRAANVATLRGAVVAVGVLPLFLLQSTPSLAESAYAFGQGQDGAWVSAYGSNYTTQSEAEAAAMQKCMGRGIACSIIASFRKTCFAIAVQDFGNGWAVRYGPDLPSANRSALQGCAAMGLSCSIKNGFCDTISEQELKQAALDQANREFQQYLNEWNGCFAATQSEVDAAAAIGSCNQALAFPRAEPVDRDKLVRQRAVQQDRIQQIHDQSLRAEQQRQKDEADKRAYDQYYAQQEACERDYKKDACTAALRSPLADDDEREVMRGVLADLQHIKDDFAACKNGSVIACDTALVSRAVSDNDRRNLEQWREAASLFAKVAAAIVYSWTVVRFAIALIPLSTTIVTAVALLLALVLLGILLRRRRANQQPIVSHSADPPSSQPAPARESAPDHPSPAPTVAKQQAPKQDTTALEATIQEIATRELADPASAADRPTTVPKIDKAAIKRSLITKRVEFEL